MLVLKRYAKQFTPRSGEAQIRIELPDGDVIDVVLLETGKGWGRIGILAPPGITIHRQEYFDRLQQHHAEAQAALEQQSDVDTSFQPAPLKKLGTAVQQARLT